MIVSRLSVSRSCLGDGDTTLRRAPIPLCHRLNRGVALTVAMMSTVRTSSRLSFDVVEGSGRFYVQSMVGGSGRRLSSTAMTRYWSPSSAGIGMVCCVGGAGGDLRHVGSGAVIGVWARCGRALMLRAASWRVASWRSGMTRPVSQGVGVADGRAVVMGCDEPLARWRGNGEGRRGLVWGKSALPAGISRVQVCCWWAGGPRRLSHACHIDGVKAVRLMMV